MHQRIIGRIGRPNYFVLVSVIQQHKPEAAPANSGPEVESNTQSELQVGDTRPQQTISALPRPSPGSER